MGFLTFCRIFQMECRITAKKIVVCCVLDTPILKQNHFCALVCLFANSEPPKGPHLLLITYFAFLEFPHKTFDFVIVTESFSIRDHNRLHCSLHQSISLDFSAFPRLTTYTRRVYRYVVYVRSTIYFMHVIQKRIVLLRLILFSFG